MLSQTPDRISSCQTSRIGASAQSSPWNKTGPLVTYRSSTIHTSCRNTFDDQPRASENAYKRRWHRRHTMIDLAPLPRAGTFGHACPRRLRIRRRRILPIAVPILFHDIGAPNQKASIDGIGALSLSRSWPAACPGGLLRRRSVAATKGCRRLDDWLAPPLRGDVQVSDGCIPVLRRRDGVPRILTSDRWAEERAAVWCWVEQGGSRGSCGRM